MFDFVHENKRLIQVILALIVLPFALWGVSSYDKSRNPVDVVATVEGIKITKQEFENTLRQQQERMRQQLGANFDVAMLDNPGMRRMVIDSLVSRHLLVERAIASNLVVPDEQVAQAISGVEVFQDGGKFDKKRYETVLANQNMSPLTFEARVRDDLLGQQLQGTYEQNGYAANSAADNIIHLNEQQREVRVVHISLQPFMAQAKVDELAIKKYYDENQKEFQVQEQARVEYVKLSADNLLGKEDVSKEEILKYYDDHQKENYASPEERQAAHILVAVNATFPQSEQDAAKKKAEQILQQVRKSPAKFAELAKESSQDPGSASKGGDLGFFRRGMMVKPFEDAAFSLKTGEVSGLVKSDFGYHIIKLLAIKPSRVTPFDEVRESIANKLRQQKAMELFAGLAEKFSNTVYEQSDTLKPAATLANSKIEQSGWLVKGIAAGKPWTEKMLQSIFNDDVVKNKRNSVAVEVEPNVLVSARILEYKPASVRAFADVQESIRQKLLRQQAKTLAEKQGKAILEQLQGGAGKQALDWGAAQYVTRAKHDSMDAGIVQQIFQVNSAKLPQYIGAEDAQNGYELVRVDSVKEGEPINDAKRGNYVQQLRKLTGEEMSHAYLADARQKAAVTINLPEPAAVQP